MWEGQPRSDGLLRGARTERIEQMLAFRHTTWSLEVLLGVHCGLLDHACEVREAAMESLLELAAKGPAAVPVTPASLLAYYMGTFTVASGIDLAVVSCLAELRTSEADELLVGLLVSGSGSNEQFKRWLEILRAKDRQEILDRVQREKLSPKRKATLNQLR